MTNYIHLWRGLAAGCHSKNCYMYCISISWTELVEVFSICDTELFVKVTILIHLLRVETKRFVPFKQTSANTSTWYGYLSKICRFVNYLCMNLCKITPKHYLQPRFEYRHFRQIWRIHVEAKRISSNYSCFSPFVFFLFIHI